MLELAVILGPYGQRPLSPPPAGVVPGVRTLCVRDNVDILFGVAVAAIIGEETGKESGFGGLRMEFARTSGAPCPCSLDLARSRVINAGGPTRCTEDALIFALPSVIVVVSIFKFIIDEEEIVFPVILSILTPAPPPPSPSPPPPTPLTRFFAFVAITG